MTTAAEQGGFAAFLASTRANTVTELTTELQRLVGRVPRALTYRHPDGHERPAGPGDYQPHIEGRRPVLADGRPAPYCAGWAAVVHIREPYT